MGTHISRVKSVDLDAWNDEQLQSVLRWGNSRANKWVVTISNYIAHLTISRYWEAKLAAGHVPSEAYITPMCLSLREILIDMVQKNREFHPDKV